MITLLIRCYDFSFVYFYQVVLYGRGVISYFISEHSNTLDTLLRFVCCDAPGQLPPLIKEKKKNTKHLAPHTLYFVQVQ